MLLLTGRQTKTRRDFIPCEFFTSFVFVSTAFAGTKVKQIDYAIHEVKFAYFSEGEASLTKVSFTAIGSFICRTAANLVAAAFLTEGAAKGSFLPIYLV